MKDYPGPHLDLDVAQQVMGYKRCSIIDGVCMVEPPPCRGVVRFSPSTDLTMAWSVVEKMRRDRHLGAVINAVTQPAGYWCVGWDDLGDAAENDRELTAFYAEAQELPLAICRAAITAVTPPEHEVKA